MQSILNSNIVDMRKRGNLVIYVHKFKLEYQEKFCVVVSVTTWDERYKKILKK